MILEIIEKGGPTVWPILILSVIALGIVIERMAYRWSMRGSSSALLGQVRSSLEEGMPVLPPEGGGLPGKLAREYFRTSDLDEDLRSSILKREAERGLAAWNANVRFLALVAALSPLIGLGGTVLGLVDAFRAIEAAGGQVNPGSLAGGIWAALLSTVAGMLVAIPCTMAHHYFQAGTESMARNLKFLIGELDELVRTHVPHKQALGQGRESSLSHAGNTRREESLTCS